MVGIDTLNSGDFVKIFYSKNVGNITEGVREDFLSSKAQIEGHRVSITHKNALDFQLSVDLGRLSREKGFRRFSIISKDTGFQSVVAYMKKAEKSVITDQYPTIIEARMAEEKNYMPQDISRRSKKLRLDITLAELERYRQFDVQLKMAVPDLTEEELETIRSIYVKSEAKTVVYRNVLKSFGRVRGLMIYRSEQAADLTHKYLKGA